MTACSARSLLDGSALRRRSRPQLPDVLRLRLQIQAVRTRPYTPRTNGKVERFIQTSLREWAYAKPYR